MKKNYKIFALLSFILPGCFVPAFAQTFTFTCPDTITTWTVPTGVTSIGVDMQGGTGGENSIEGTGFIFVLDRGGNGARVQGTLTVVPGQILNIYVGGAGPVGITGTNVPGGFNGGGWGMYAPTAGITPNICGGGGGGASDIRIGGIALANRVMIAAGGGGAGGNYVGVVDYDRGGDGGGTTGEAGWAGNAVGGFGAGGAGSSGSGGTGGTSLGLGLGAGGAGGLGFGGSAGIGSAGGGGGGGYYGGGGSCYGGGGGGSSYTDPSVVSAVTHTRGYNTSGCGTVTICLLDPGIISGAKPLCTGQTLALTESVAGGTWSSGNTSIATIGSSSGIVKGVAGGSVVISYTLTTPCATVHAVTTITVISAPLPISGVDSVCVGSSIVLNDATSGGVWSSSNTAFATVTGTGIVSGIYPGVSTITYSIPPAGCTSILSVKVDGIAGLTDVCTGSTVTLVESNSDGMWTSSNSASATIDTSGVVTGISIGTSIISYSSLGCPEYIVMTVNPIAPVLGADSVCVGGSAYFTDIVGIGSWYSSDTSIAIVSTGPGLVSGVSAGTALISFVSPAGCMAKTSVNIIPLPKIITGILHVCPGTSTTVADSTSGGVWSSNNTSVATVGATGVVTGVNADTTSVFYTVRPGCTISATVKVNPLPMPITGRDTVCPGIIDTLHDASPGGVWASSTPVVDTIIDSNGILTTRLSGTGIVNYTLPTGCTISKSIDVYSVPSPVITYNKFTNTFYAPTGYPHYQWYDSISGKIPFANSPSLAGIYTQWYYVVITDTNGCLSASAIDHFNLDITRVNNITSTVIRIYPNPVTGIVYIESPVNVRAVINTIDGKTVLDQADAKELDISNFAGGVYLITLYDDDKKVLTTRKLIKE